MISGQCETYSFNITNNGNQCEVRMNETFAGIKLWIFPNENCPTLFESNPSGVCHPKTDSVSVEDFSFVQIYNNPHTHHISTNALFTNSCFS